VSIVGSGMSSDDRHGREVDLFFVHIAQDLERLRAPDLAR
jgi:hypothetical protein